MDLESAFAVPQKWFAKNAANLNTTERQESRSYWHIPLTTLDDGSLAINLSKIGRKYSLEPHRFPLAPRSWFLVSSFVSNLPRISSISPRKPVCSTRA